MSLVVGWASIKNTTALAFEKPVGTTDKNGNYAFIALTYLLEIPVLHF